MPICIVQGCEAKWKGLKLYTLPNASKDAARLRKWLDITGNPHISLEEADVYRKSDRYAVCEKHFTEDAFENMMRVRMVGGLLRLKKNAVPTENISGTSSANRADSRVNDASLSDNDEPIDISNAEVECSYAQEGNKTVDDKDGDASVPIAKRSGNSHNYCRHDQKKRSESQIPRYPNYSGNSRQVHSG